MRSLCTHPPQGAQARALRIALLFTAGLCKNHQKSAFCLKRISEAFFVFLSFFWKKKMKKNSSEVNLPVIQFWNMRKNKKQEQRRSVVVSYLGYFFAKASSEANTWRPLLLRQKVQTFTNFPWKWRDFQWCLEGYSPRIGKGWEWKQVQRIPCACHSQALWLAEELYGCSRGLAKKISA